MVLMSAEHVEHSAARALILCERQWLPEAAGPGRVFSSVRHILFTRKGWHVWKGPIVRLPPPIPN